MHWNYWQPALCGLASSDSKQCFCCVLVPFLNVLIM
jgi:hypothetical protein